MRAGHRLRGGVRGCSSGIVSTLTVKIVGSELSERTRTHTLFEYPLGKPIEAIKNTLLKESTGARSTGIPFYGVFGGRYVWSVHQRTLVQCLVK